MSVAELLGLPKEYFSDLRLLDAVKTGLPISTVDALVRGGHLLPEEVDRLVAPREEIARRSAEDRPLSTAESDCLVRIAWVLFVAQDNFGDPERAFRWLRTPNRALEGAIPLELLDTGAGARLVEHTILRIAHGVFM